MGDTVGTEKEGYALVDVTAVLADGIRGLPNLREALGGRFSQKLTQVEVARRLGCSQMHVSRLIRRATDRLRRRLELSR